MTFFSTASATSAMEGGGLRSVLTVSDAGRTGGLEESIPGFLLSEYDLLANKLVWREVATSH